MFYGTSIATYVLVLKKSRKDNQVLFIDASQDYVKVSNNNRLTTEHIDKILGAFVDRQNIEYYCKVASTLDIQNPDYNFSVYTYVSKKYTRENIDILELNQTIASNVAK